MSGPLTCELDRLVVRQDAAQRLQQTLSQQPVPVALGPVVPQTAVFWENKEEPSSQEKLKLRHTTSTRVQPINKDRNADRKAQKPLQATVATTSITHLSSEVDYG